MEGGGGLVEWLSLGALPCYQPVGLLLHCVVELLTVLSTLMGYRADHECGLPCMYLWSTSICKAVWRYHKHVGSK